MKFLMMLLLLTSFACNPKQDATPAAATAAALDSGKEEDCDTKAQQKVEITEESISLTNPDAGCSLEDAPAQK